MSLKKLLCSSILIFLFLTLKATEVIRINQLGYLPHSIKVAVFLSSEDKEVLGFTVHHAISDAIVFTGETQPKPAGNWGMKTAFRMDFSELDKHGAYYIKAGEVKSPDFRIDGEVYEGIADFILNYLRQQRCGYNPFLEDSCHTHDGIIVDHPSRSGEKIDVTGGWHDATDYLQYSTTSINTVFQMMFAYQQFPHIYGDKFDESGLTGSNGIPDILDEIKWGLDWMLKMNPAAGEMYNQIADDRDHVGFRLPVGDTADYGLGKYRPVYFVTGKPQGLAEFKNTSTGVSSIAGKFASGFALGSELFQKLDSEFSKQLKQKALDAWEFALSDIGYTQTACNISPYYYEERNFVDDLELAAAQLFKLTGEDKFLQEAESWGKKEPLSPWIKNDTAGHYESYPFVNLGHFLMIEQGKNNFTSFYEQGLNLLYERGKNDPFYNGLPFLWCSNNLVAAAITQAHLYREQSDDMKFAEMEAALRDWLFGCNPWGTAMICGLPGAENSPMLPHSSYTVLLGGTTPGGLVDGPIETRRHKQQIGIVVKNPEEYAAFNKGKAVYNDDIGDYATNEPTMDGTASLSFYLASLENEGREQTKKVSYTKDETGAIVRINPEQKNIYLTFTGDELFEGGSHVIETLRSKNVKGSFFLTGNFLRNPAFEPIVKQIIADGHYLGVHSDKHLLYCDWQKQDSTLVTFDEFKSDVANNFKELQRYGIQADEATFFMPPFEWCNKEIVGWAKKLGLDIINFTSGTGTNADYTTPDMKNYKSSDELWNNLVNFEKTNNKSLNGAVLLIHPGTEDARKDKFYRRLSEIIDYYSKKGFGFKSLME